MPSNSELIDTIVEKETERDDKPPIFKKWNQVYAFVLILHAIIIALFYFFTHAYA